MYLCKKLLVTKMTVRVLKVSRLYIFTINVKTDHENSKLKKRKFKNKIIFT